RYCRRGFMDPPGLHHGDGGHRLRLLPRQWLECHLGIIRTGHVRRGRAIGTGAAGWAVLAEREPARRRSRLARGLRDLDIYLVAAQPSRRRLAWAGLARCGSLRDRMAEAPAVVRPGRHGTADSRRLLVPAF